VDFFLGVVPIVMMVLGCCPCCREHIVNRGLVVVHVVVIVRHGRVHTVVVVDGVGLTAQPRIDLGLRVVARVVVVVQGSVHTIMVMRRVRLPTEQVIHFRFGVVPIVVVV